MVNGKIIKVCGMREAENIQEIESLQDIDMLGFIFYPKSPRYVYEKVRITESTMTMTNP